MNPWDSVDIYCERIAPGLLGEPLNLVSNASFLIAAGLATRWLRASPPVHRSLWLLTLLGGSIGVGSSLFHSFATAWALLADVLPIALYLIAYIGIGTRLLLGLSWKRVALIYAAFGALSGICILIVPSSAVGGSQGYFGSAITILGFAFALRKEHPQASKLLRTSALLFGAALVFRSVDEVFCEGLPMGTHWAWHLLNGAVVACSLRAAILLDATHKEREVRVGAD